MEPLVIAQIATVAVQDNLFALAVGFAACGLLLRRAGGATPAALYRAQFACYGALLAAGGLYLWLQAAVMSGAPFADAGGALGAVLTQSHFGRVWLLGYAGIALALRGSARAQRGAALAACGALLYAAGKAAAGHAADAGDFSLAEAVHTVHLSATAVWAGSVIAAALGLMPWRRPIGAALSNPAQQLAFRTGLSQLATIALVVVIATGLYNVVQDTAHTSGPLLATEYGRLLTLKLGLVTLALLIGGWNRMAGLPQIRAAVPVARASCDGEAAEAAEATASATLRRFDRLLALEAVVMVLILIVAAALGHTSPQGYDG